LNLISNKIINSHHKRLPFVVFRKPKSDIISGFFQQNDQLFFSKNYTESGFVFAPFNDEDDAVLIPENESEFLQEKVNLNKEFKFSKEFTTDISSKENYLKLVDKAIYTININGLEKVVLSRKESIKLSDFNLLEVYEKLLHKYPNAYSYIWFHPKIGLWIGATPEKLLHISQASFETVSLAGTQVYNGTENVLWKSKELQEQLLVTNFIKSQLAPISTDLKINTLETVKAGDLLHLRTKVSGKLIHENLQLKTLIRSLHPTPAVCGLPRKKSKDFIIKNENYKRTYYTGFLGELNVKNHSSSLFVNLRCMEIENNIAQIYIGGGITKDSKPEKEWEETVSKSNVMKSVL